MSTTASPSSAVDQAHNGPATEVIMRNADQLANCEESKIVASPDGSIPSAVLEIADTNLKSALLAYLTSTALAHDIARQHGFTISVLSYWARKLGLPLRRRGRRHLVQPNLRHRRILTLVQRYGIAAAARRIGRSRQYVHQLVGRWAPELHPVRTAPPVAYRRRRAGQQPRDFVVSWNARDAELVGKVASVAVRIKNEPGRPRRVTVRSIGRELRIHTMLQMHKDKMPRTKLALKAHVESTEQFVLRRIQWTVATLKIRGNRVTRSEIMRVAGVAARALRMRSVRDAIDRATEDLVFLPGRISRIPMSIPDAA